MTGTKEKEETLLEIKTIIKDLKGPMSIIGTKISSILEKIEQDLIDEEKSALLFRIEMINTSLGTIAMLIDSTIGAVNKRL